MRVSILWAVLLITAMAAPVHAATAQKKIKPKPSPSPTAIATATPVSTPRIRRVIKVNSIHFEGNQAFSDSRLLKVMLTRKPHWFKKEPYLPEVFEMDLARILDLYHRRGYSQAEIDDKDVLEDRATSRVDLTVWIYEGPLSEVKDVRWEGVTALDPKTVKRRMFLKTGDALDSDRLEASVRNLLRAYAEAGFLEAEIKPVLAWDDDRKDAELILKVKEGPVCRLADLMISGLVRMRNWVVGREFHGLKRGSPLRWNKVEAAQTRLYLTGLFRSLVIKPLAVKDAAPGTRNLSVEVQEAQAREINLSGGWGTEDHVHGQVELIHNNMFGRARRMSVLASAGRRIQHLEWNYGTFWIAGLPWFNNLNTFGELQQQPGYDLRRLGGSFMIGRNLSSVSKFQIAYRHENAYLGHVTLEPAPDLSASTVRAFSLSLVLDKRDNFANTKAGLYLASSAEISGSFLSGTDTFVKTTHDLRIYHSFGTGTVVASGVQLGYVHNYRSNHTIPISELFFAGGANSLRGFEYRTVGPLDPQGLPLGGEFSLVFNAGEVRQKLWRFLGVVGFIDGGNVFALGRQFTFGALRWTGGYGLRAETRMGILRVDQGFIIDRKPGEKPMKIVFSLGQAF